MSGKMVRVRLSRGVVDRLAWHSAWGTVDKFSEWVNKRAPRIYAGERVSVLAGEKRAEKELKLVAGGVGLSLVPSTSPDCDYVATKIFDVKDKAERAFESFAGDFPSEVVFLSPGQRLAAETSEASVKAEQKPAPAEEKAVAEEPAVEEAGQQLTLAEEIAASLTVARVEEKKLTIADVLGEGQEDLPEPSAPVAREEQVKMTAEQIEADKKTVESCHLAGKLSDLQYEDLVARIARKERMLDALKPPSIVRRMLWLLPTLVPLLVVNWLAYSLLERLAIYGVNVWPVLAAPVFWVVGAVFFRLMLGRRLRSAVERYKASAYVYAAHLVGSGAFLASALQPAQLYGFFGLQFAPDYVQNLRYATVAVVLIGDLLALWRFSANYRKATGRHEPAKQSNESTPPRRSGVGEAVGGTVGLVIGRVLAGVAEAKAVAARTVETARATANAAAAQQKTSSVTAKSAACPHCGSTQRFGSFCGGCGRRLNGK